MEKKSGCMGLLELLLVVFIVLKLTKLITWGWFYVLMPLWIELILIAIILIIKYYM